MNMRAMLIAQNQTCVVWSRDMEQNVNWIQGTKALVPQTQGTRLFWCKMTSYMPTKRRLRIGSRRSNLAQLQANEVRSTLISMFPDCEIPEVTLISSAGDKDRSKPLYEMEGKAIWTKELEQSLFEDEIDLIVHSLKDMPTTLPEGARLAAVTKREDSSDVLVVKPGLPYISIDELPEGAVVGTSAIRRMAQIRQKWPHLQLASVRGNIETRLGKLDDPASYGDDCPNYDAIVLAAAGLRRAGLQDRIAQSLAPPLLYHAVGQGALGIETRDDDDMTNELVTALSDPPTLFCTLAERAALRTLEGGCSVPIGVESYYNENLKTLTLTCCVVALDGSRQVKHNQTVSVQSTPEAEKLGVDVASVLISNGADVILADIPKKSV